MFFILNKILGTLIGGILYPLLITAPLQILNGIYQAFQICCGASIGGMFFNQSQGSLIIDVNAPIFKFIIRTLIICLILMLVMIVVLAIEHLVTKKKINLLSKIKWPLIAVTSTVTIPLAFMLMSSLSVAFMGLVGGTTVQLYLLTANVSDIMTNMNNGLQQLASSQAFDVTVTDAINKLREAVQNISQEAVKTGLQDLVDKCRLTMEYLDTMSSTLTNWDANILQPFNDVMSYINNPVNWQSGNVKFSAEITEKLKSVIGNLNDFQMSWNNTISGISDILKDASIYCKDVLSKELSFGDNKITIEALLRTVNSNWSDVWGKFNNLWIFVNEY